MNGWQRLWVLSSVIYLALVALVTLVTLPGKSSVDGVKVLRHLSDHSLEVLAAAKNAQIRHEEDGGSVYYEAEGLNPSEAAALKADSASAAAGALREMRLHSLGLAVAAWIVPCIVIYAFGFGVAWVRRGFKRRAP